MESNCVAERCREQIAGRMGCSQVRFAVGIDWAGNTAAAARDAALHVHPQQPSQSCMS
jgi:hypothetical protein